MNRYSNQMQLSFSAEVFMCQHHNTGSGLGYWSLRLLTGNRMIEAFHWDKEGRAVMDYKVNDEILVGGHWSIRDRSRFQVLESSILMRVAANDPVYFHQKQVEIDFAEKSEYERQR